VKRRKWAAAALLSCLLMALVLSMPLSGHAATLTSGNYTYVINGEEAALVFDPVQVDSALLFPAIVFQQFGVSVVSQDQAVILSKQGVTAELILGSTTFHLNGRPLELVAAPIRLNGRLFLPDALLGHFGVDHTVTGRLIIMRDLARAMPPVRDYPEDEYRSLKEGRSLSGSVQSDSGVLLRGEFMLLDEQLVTAGNLDLPYGVRARLVTLLESNTLVLVTLHNGSTKSGAMLPGQMYLVDDLYHQYDLLRTVDVGEGDIGAKLAPGASRRGVLVFRKSAADARLLTLYYDANNAPVGTFTKMAK
jgi:hypothetical protein